MIRVACEGRASDHAEVHVFKVDSVRAEDVLDAPTPKQQPLPIDRTTTCDSYVLQGLVAPVSGLGHDKRAAHLAVVPGLDVVRAKQRRPILNMKFLVI